MGVGAEVMWWLVGTWSLMLIRWESLRRSPVWVPGSPLKMMRLQEMSCGVFSAVGGCHHESVPGWLFCSAARPQDPVPQSFLPTRHLTGCALGTSAEASTREISSHKGVSIPELPAVTPGCCPQGIPTHHSGQGRGLSALLSWG